MPFPNPARCRSQAVGIAAVLAFLFFRPPTVRGDDLHDPMDDAAGLEFEQFAGSPSGTSGGSLPEAGRRAAGFAFFPLGRPGGRTVFGGLRGEWIEMSLPAPSEGASGSLLQRYSASAGTEIIKTAEQESFALFSGGYHGDFRRMAGEGIGLEFLYAHMFIPSPTLKWGMGMDLMRFLDGWFPFPLVLLDWRILERTKLRINIDFAEVRQFVGPRICLTLGMRYNLFYGAVGSGGEYRMEAVGAEVGGEYRILRSVVLRIKAKSFFWGEETLRQPSRGPERTDAVEGGSLRLSLAFLP